jgi:PAB-dependent poly(A)-specific ribonuclease subunit 2
VWIRSDERFQNLTSMAFTSRGTSEILVGGAHSRMFTANLERGTVGTEVGYEREQGQEAEC